MKREFEEWITENIKANSKLFFKYVRNGKSARQVVGPLDDKGMRGLLKGRLGDDKETVFLVFVFIIEGVGHIPTPELAFSGMVSQIEVLRDKVPGLLGKLKNI